MQVEWKWCGGFNKDNFKHKLYMAHNLWEEAPLPSLYYTLCLSTRTTFNTLNGSPKTKTFIVLEFWTFISFSNQVIFENARAIVYSLQKDISNGV